MISGWDNLIDRCLLYAEAPRQMIKNLLMEAEDELTRDVDLAVKMVRAVTPLFKSGTGSISNPISLPNDFKKIVEVRYKGEVLPQIDRHKIDYDTENKIKSGTPTGYYISPSMYGDMSPAVWLDKNPPDGEHLNIYYYAQLSRMEDGSFTVPILKKGDASGGGASDGALTLGTDLGPVLDGAVASFGGVYSIPTNVTLIYNRTDAFLRQNQSTNFLYDPTSTSVHKYSGTASVYNHTSAVVSTYGDKAVLINDYRKYAPIVAQMYRISLCNYAIALSQAKSSPEMHDKHYALWLQDVEKIKNESADKDLNHTIKEVV